MAKSGKHLLAVALLVLFLLNMVACDIYKPAKLNAPNFKTTDDNTVPNESEKSTGLTDEVQPENDSQTDTSDTADTQTDLETNVLYLNIDGQLNPYTLESVTQTLGISASFKSAEESGNTLSVVTIQLPANVVGGDEYTSQDAVDTVSGNGGVFLYDSSTGASYSAMNTGSITEDNDYFGLGEMTGDNQYSIVIDYTKDGIISGRFTAEYAHSDYNSSDSPLSIEESSFVIDLNNLPAPKSNTDDTEDPFADNTFNDLLGPIESDGISSNSGGASASGDICLYCKGTGIKDTCSLCGGVGYNDNELDTLYKGAYVCPSCLGAGVLDCIHCENGIAY